MQRKIDEAKPLSGDLIKNKTDVIQQAPLELHENNRPAHTVYHANKASKKTGSQHRHEQPWIYKALELRSKRARRLEEQKDDSSALLLT